VPDPAVVVEDADAVGGVGEAGGSATPKERTY
jgi:hypothetical protein